MVYSISDKIEQVLDPGPTGMDSKFHRVKTDEKEADTFLGPKETWRIWKNVLVIGFAFMVHFTAFWGASNLQSSIHIDAALGTFTLAAIYGSLILSNIFLPTIVIRWLGVKWTIAFAFVTYMPFLASQFYPAFYTMIPGGLAVGLGGGPLWCAKCTIISILADAYSKITGAPSDIMVTKFFGVFFMFYQFSQVWGNLISSAVLSSGQSSLLDTNLTVTENITKIMNELTTSEKDTSFCGANFCPAPPVDANETTSNISALIEVSTSTTEKINTIMGIYLACMIAACLIVVFGVDSPKRYDQGRKGSGSGLSGFRLLAVTLAHLKNPYQLLILPITVFIGAEQAFLAADFNAAFVTCGWDVSNIGFVMICFGVCNGLAAIFIGNIIKLTGRKPVLALALALHIALIVSLLNWQPNQTNFVTYFVIAGLWGFCDAVWLVQINSLYGILFPGKEEATYSNFRLWESTGSVITYAYSPYICVHLKLYLLLGLLLIGAAGYSTVEFLEWKNGSGEVETNKGQFKLVKGEPKSGEVAE